MTSDEAAIERMARAFVGALRRNRANLTDRQAEREIDAISRHWIVEMRAVLAALLADPPPAVERAVLEQLIARADNQEWGGTVRADLWLRRELAELAREERNAPDVI